jgi:CoA:oxalate CoA-transferase
VNNALEDIRIVDLSRAMAGPFCTMILGDMGADVIKIEAPEGDETRKSHPKIDNISTMFLSINRNKRSVTANLKDATDVAMIKKLIARADILVENFRPGVMNRLGLTYDELHALNPQLIYASCSGFGQTGPYRNLPAYDIVVQAYGGLMSATGPEGQGPTKAGFSFGDIAAGLFATVGILAALCERTESGLGQYVDVAMLDSQIAISENALARYLYEGEDPAPIGNRHPSIAPNDAFIASDGKIMIAAGNEKLWLALCVALDRIDLTTDERFKTNDKRNRYHAELKNALEKTLGTKTVAHWCKVLSSAGIPADPIYGYEDVANSPEIQASGMIQDIKHPVSNGLIKVPGFPIHFSRTPCALTRRPPLLGEHNEEIQQMTEDCKG